MDEANGSGDRTSSPKRLLSPGIQVAVKLITALLPIMTALIGGLWMAGTYLRDQQVAATLRADQGERDTTARLIEARKPFVQEQLKRYLETGAVVARLVSTTRFKGTEWQDDVRRFNQLYWVELSIVEDNEVKIAMQAFGGKLAYLQGSVDPPLSSEDQAELQGLSYSLARAIKQSIEKSWSIGLSR